MAPPLPATSLQSETTERCASSSSSCPCKESSPSAVNRRHGRRFFSNPGAVFRRIRRRSSSSGQMNPTIGFLVMFSISLTTRSSPSPSVSSLYLGDRRRPLQVILVGRSPVVPRPHLHPPQILHVAAHLRRPLPRPASASLDKPGLDLISAMAYVSQTSA
jgi:hypothetical protein